MKKVLFSLMVIFAFVACKEETTEVVETPVVTEVDTLETAEVQLDTAVTEESDTVLIMKEEGTF